MCSVPGPGNTLLVQRGASLRDVHVHTRKDILLHPITRFTSYLKHSYSNARLVHVCLFNLCVDDLLNLCFVKDDMPVCNRSELFTSNILTIFKQ